jgi:hypothetical protein
MFTRRLLPFSERVQPPIPADHWPRGDDVETRPKPKKAAAPIARVRRGGRPRKIFADPEEQVRYDQKQQYQRRYYQMTCGPTNHRAER